MPSIAPRVLFWRLTGSLQRPNPRCLPWGPRTVWQRAIWQDPELDYTLQRPVSTLGKRQWQDSRSAERNAAMAQLSERYGLFYFFAQSCGACEVMSPIVQSVASTWQAPQLWAKK